MAKYLLDTCVWRDFYENRRGRNGRHLGEIAAKLVLRLIADKSIILFSDALIYELSKYFKEKEIEEMLAMLLMNKALVKIMVTAEEFRETKRLSTERNIPLIDCLNAVQARNYDAILVTQDKHILNELSDIKKAVKPEELI